MSNNKKYDQVDLIVPIAPRSEPQQREFVDKGGGETHGLTDVWAAISGKKSVDADSIKASFDTCVGQVNQIISKLKTDTILGWEAESISVGLAVSAEGSIGIATVGTEATIEITFSPKKS